MSFVIHSTENKSAVAITYTFSDGESVTSNCQFPIDTTDTTITEYAQAWFDAENSRRKLEAMNKALQSDSE